MKTLHHLGAMLLLLLICAAPVMACVAPDTQMTAEESVCCRMMRSQCGEVQAPVSQDCCVQAPGAVFQNALTSTVVKFRPDMTPVRIASFEMLNRDEVRRGWIQSPEHSPPKAPPAAIHILRI